MCVHVCVRMGGECTCVCEDGRYVYMCACEDGRCVYVCVCVKAIHASVGLGLGLTHQLDVSTYLFSARMLGRPPPPTVDIPRQISTTTKRV